MELKIEYLTLDKLKPYEKNARKHKEVDLSTIKASISEFGMSDPIGVWGKNNIIVEGHGRYLACKELGIEEVPVIHLDHLSDEQRRAYTLAHNKTAEMSEWDFDLLGDELKDIFDIDMSDFGFDIPEEEEETEVIEDEVPEEVEPVAKQGDIWQLGRHRLMCGDSTNIDDVEKLMDGAKVDLVFTDPPYGYEYKSNYQDKFEMIKNDDKILDYISAILPFLNDCAVYSFCGWQSVDKWIKYFNNTELQLKNMIIWKKNNWSMGDLKCAYAGQYEICLFLNYGKKELTGKRYTDVWEFDREPPKLHPTMKPIELITFAVKNSSKDGDNVLDVFGGSGSTLIACEQLDRNCYMMELDPHYVDVIIARWETFTGQKAVLLNG